MVLLGLLLLAAGGAPAAEFQDCAECPVMVSLPGGTFDRGLSAMDRGRPATVPAFALGKFEVTSAEFAAFVAATWRDMRPGCSTYTLMGAGDDPAADWRHPGFDQSGNGPALCVSWEDAAAYVGWLSEFTGRAYRLPSEAEWEYAARAGAANDVTYYFRANLLAFGANCQDCGGFDMMGHEGQLSARDVGSYGPNALGIHDLMGNAAEWVADCFNPTLDGAPANGAAWLEGICSRRIQRGGAWQSSWAELAGYRHAEPVAARSNSVGFRVARDLP